MLTSGELRVVDPAGAEVPPDAATLGEITVRGNVVMDGLCNDPEATKKAMGDGSFRARRRRRRPSGRASWRCGTRSRT